MAVSRYINRRTNLYRMSLTTPTDAGPYTKVFRSLERKAPFEVKSAFNRTIRINYVHLINDVWFVELYLILDRLEILEVSAEPDSEDQPNFLEPSTERSFATRTCAVFDTTSKLCAIEYVRNGPKMFDFVELLSIEAIGITKKQGTQFSLTPVIEENFIAEINNFERIRQVKVVFERPNPGWGDIGILSDELEGSLDAKREVTLTAPRTGSISKDRGIIRFIKKALKTGKTTISNVVVSGKRPGDAAETQASSQKSEAKHIARLPVTDDDDIYRRSFIKVIVPFVSSPDEPTD